MVYFPLSPSRFPNPMDLALASSTFHYPRLFRRNIPPKLLRQTVILAAQKKIDGVSDELNSIASQNLDHAPARRRVRSAFANVQQHLDHILFKVFTSSNFFSKKGLVFIRLLRNCFVCRWLQLGSEPMRWVVIFKTLISTTAELKYCW